MTKTAAKKDEPTPPADDAPEAHLAAYWRARTGLAWSDFDVFADVPPPLPAGTNCRGRAVVLEEYRTRTCAELMQVVIGLIWNGWPLSRAEYHLALAYDILLTDLPYEEFFRTRWYENAEKRGYGPAPPE